MKSKQFCSVCKQWLDMEVVPTGEGDDDDGVVWFRCPQCQGFLPKLSSQLAAEAEDAAADPAAESAPAEDTTPTTPEARPEPDSAPAADEMPWDSPADMMAAREAADTETADTSAPAAAPDDDDKDADEADGEDTASADESAEPLAEYAALLAAADVSTARPYRPWESYEVGDCVHHLAWDDCGVVVANEDLPGGRHVIKCYFEAAGVVRLIEKAPR